jgi:hypothetical protein
MENIYLELNKIAAMQMDLISDNEMPVPLSVHGYYVAMWLDCGEWPEAVGAALAVACENAVNAHAFEEGYSVVKLQERSGYTKIVLYTPVESEGKAYLKEEIVLCSNSDLGEQLILNTYRRKYGKLIIV